MVRFFILIHKSLAINAAPQHNSGKPGSAFGLLFILVLGIVTLSVSCSKINKYTEECDLPYYTIGNEVLKNEITEYINSVKMPSVSEKMLHIGIQSSNDTVSYTLSYDDCGFIQLAGFVFYAKIDTMTVAFSLNDYADFDISLTEHDTWRYIKNIFKTDYEYSLNHDFYPIPLDNKDISPFWILIFKGDELIDKEILGGSE